MSGVTKLLVTSPINELGNLLRLPLGVETSMVVLGMVVIWYGLVNLTYYKDSACAKNVTCGKIFKPVDLIFEVVLSFMVVAFFAYYFYEGLKSHSLTSFKAYAKVLAAFVFLKALKVVLTSLTSVLSTSSLSTTDDFKTVTQKFFGRIVDYFGSAEDTLYEGLGGVPPLVPALILGFIARK